MAMPRRSERIVVGVIFLDAEGLEGNEDHRENLLWSNKKLVFFDIVTNVTIP